MTDLSNTPQFAFAAMVAITALSLWFAATVPSLRRPRFHSLKVAIIAVISAVVVTLGYVAAIAMVVVVIHTVSGWL